MEVQVMKLGIVLFCPEVICSVYRSIVSLHHLLSSKMYYQGHMVDIGAVLILLLKANTATA
jgi:hypothetical protein